MRPRRCLPLVLLALLAPAPTAAAAGPAAPELERAWTASRGAGALVAVLDSGVDGSHPDLSGALWTNPGETPDGRDNDANGIVDDVHGADLVDGDGDPRDEHGHGTAEAGIVAGRGLTVAAGVAPAATLLPVRVLDAENRGTTREAAAGIRYALDRGARIVLMALNTDDNDPDLAEAIALAERAGAVIVTTAGNSGRDLDSRPSYPASLASPAVLTVGALGDGGARAWFSNFGAVVDVLAPGTGIPAAARGGGGTFLDGTSPAAAWTCWGRSRAWAGRAPRSAGQRRGDPLAGAPIAVGGRP